MIIMNIIDVIGPVMIGPSSSHTAGAVRLGLIARSILGAPIKKAEIFLHGSFAETYKGHGTDMALLAGLMYWLPDDERIPRAMEYAVKEGIEYKFHKTDLGAAIHPNTVMFMLYAVNGSYAEIVGSSIGGGQVLVTNIDGMEVEFTGKLPALITSHIDKPGVINTISGILADDNINIATMRLFRDNRGGLASLLIECDQDVPSSVVGLVQSLDSIVNVKFIPKIL